MQVQNFTMQLCMERSYWQFLYPCMSQKCSHLRRTSYVQGLRNHVHAYDIQGGPQISLFFFGNKFYKNKETFKIFSPQILEVYRILLVETTVESIMFYYTFSVINTMFVPCTALLYDSTAATRTLKLSTTLLSISCGIRLISFLMMPSLVCGLFSQTLSFRYLLRRLSGGLKSWEQDGQGLSVARDMSLSRGKLCLRNSSALFEK